LLCAKIVTLTTDFGLKDPYAAAMKAAILGINPGIVIIDVTHDVEKFNVRAGAFVLGSVAPYFPEGTVHVAVVDPGVGPNRRSIAIETKHGFFVGPDNGLLILPAEAQGIKHIYEITSRRFMLSHVSSTFHGRDIFAPVAAHLANGTSIEEFGPQLTDVVRPEFTKVARNEGQLVGEVLHVDDFGNIITNINAKDLQEYRYGMILIELPNFKVQLKVSRTYTDAKPNEPLALLGSHNYLEIALNQGSAAEKFGSKVGDKITLRNA
jgi:S-adenosyl-L-methionine hydrolase (adenosine-forming)